jgi:tRNA pseudouridine38-40 synthase
MPNYKLIIQYKGTNYAGWQIQPNAETVQQKITDSLQQILGKNINLIGSGRTDSGVHAVGQVANFLIDTKINENKLHNSLNSLLPDDIAISGLIEVNEKFHSRFDAKKRSYIYLFSDSKSPFYSEFAPKVTFIDNQFVSNANLLSKQILGEHDFTSFSKKNTETKNNLCEIYNAHWRKNGQLTLFYIQANRYLHGMVRAIVGTVTAIIRNNNEESLTSILAKKERDAAGMAAPAKGLFLYKVNY